MKKLQLFLIIALSIIASLSIGANEERIMKSTDAIKLLLSKQIKKGTPGIAVAVYKEGQVEILVEGYANLKSKTAVNQDTLFEIGSISKVFTGMLLADRINSGELSLDTPIQALLPATVKAPVYADSDSQAITLKHLTTHTSGLPRLPDNMGFKLFSSDPYAQYSRKELYEFLNSHELKHSPGKSGEYSNLGTGLLGQLLADEAQQSYEQLMQATITEPLGMRNTVVKLSPEQELKFSQGHGLFGIRKNHWNFKDAIVGAGGIRSSIFDMAKFLEANIQAASKVEKNRINSNIIQSQQPLAEFDEYYQIGMGWLISESGVYWHNGGTGGFRSFMGFTPDKQVGVVILSNRTKEVDTLGMEILQVLMQ